MRHRLSTTEQAFMNTYDITFLGHMCYDEITPYQGETRVAPGSAVLCGAQAAARTGKHVAAVVKMAPADEAIVQPMRDAGIDTTLIPAADTTWSVVIHPVPDVDVRRLILKKSAGMIRLDEVPPMQTTCLHLAGISNTEFDLALIEGLAARGISSPPTCRVSSARWIRSRARLSSAMCRRSRRSSRGCRR
jgi:sugar/nucleoside kinase (ribokinase family)